MTATTPAFNVEQLIGPDADPTLTWEAMVHQALQSRVSDIHLLAHREMYDLAFRIDGDLRHQGPLTHAFTRRLISHVKSLADMDIAEHRRPTEGRMKIQFEDRAADLRISVVPSLHGADMVVRILDQQISLRELEQLGLLDEQLRQVRDLLSRPHGLILISGPTGSGKTTSLYAMLRHLTGRERKIITIEDPIEYDLPGVNQTQVNPRIDVGFANMLTAILRQDPDVIMVGEIRDQETAATAVRAANMGNLVLATTHATRASRAVETMLSLGVHPFFLAVALRGVVTQVLVRRVCKECRQEMPETVDMILDEQVRQRLPAHLMPQLYEGRGCPACSGTGYLGRTGLFELFVTDDRIKQLIMERHPAVDIDQAFADSSWLTLEQVGKLRAVTGETTMEEIVRVLPFT
jgi:type II secretory ATPase GspE/PulE/Tfp pilus assembly ATPase PilB-like protein